MEPVANVTEKKRMLSGKANAVPFAALRTGDGLSGERRKKENVYKGHLDLVLKENKKMKERIEELDKQNGELKRVVAELSRVVGRKGPSVGAFDVDKMLRHGEAAAGGDPRDAEAEHSYMDSSRVLSEAQPQASQQDDPRRFHFKYALRKHEGAVYDVGYSPCGSMLASSSFDKTVKIWHMEDSSLKQQAQSLAEHTSAVSGLSWAADSSWLLSGSFDHQLKFWDVGTGVSANTYSTEGFILSVAVDPSDANMLYAGTSDGSTCVFDRRSPELTATLRNVSASHINSIYVFKTGGGILAGDSLGAVKTWDVRRQTVIHEFRAGSLAVSHVQCSEPSQGDKEGRFISVNSYDDVLRVYRRGLSLHSERSAVPQVDLVHAVEGHTNRHYPIKSAFFEGRDYQIGSTWSVRRQGARGNDEEDSELHSPMHESDEARQGGIGESLVLATGSAEPGGGIYLFDVGGPTGTAELIQKLEGHEDRVCGVCFHPKHPIMASCSADKTVRIWTPASNFSTVTLDQ